MVDFFVIATKKDVAGVVCSAPSAGAGADAAAADEAAAVPVPEAPAQAQRRSGRHAGRRR